MFASVKGVLRRADHPITDLKSTIDAFALDKKHTYRVDHDPITGKYIHKMISI